MKTKDERNRFPALLLPGGDGGRVELYHERGMGVLVLATPGILTVTASQLALWVSCRNQTSDLDRAGILG